jgi:hypothetical protein
LTKQDHLIRISAESMDVLVYPLNGFAVVHKTRIEVLSVQRSRIGVSKYIQAVAVPVSTRL